MLVNGLKAAAAEAGVAIQAGGMGGMLGFFLSDRPVRNFADAQAADHERFGRFFRAMLERGVWLPPSGYEAMFVSSAHDDATIKHVVTAAAESFRSSLS
jgi:glutamate-1-semialdehyde 2,1-aminomutase